jgi:hypothetical protein
MNDQLKYSQTSVFARMKQATFTWSLKTELVQESTMLVYRQYFTKCDTETHNRRRTTPNLGIIMED